MNGGLVHPFGITDEEVKENLRLLNITGRYHVGDVAYVKEGFATEKAWDGKPMAFLGNASDVPIWYKFADPLLSDFVPRGRWRSPLFMPKWAARYFVRITDVDVQRLHEITDEDAIAEGVTVIGRHELNDLSKGKFIHAYATLWDSINKKPGIMWADNPFVSVYTFEFNAPEGE